MVKDFPTYEDANSGKLCEWGVKSIVTDELFLKTDEAKRLMFKIMSESITRALLNNMQKLSASGKTSVFLEIQRDAELRAFEYVAILEAIAATSSDQYVAEAYRSWLLIKNELEYWQQKSLWQFITYWWKRKIKPLEERWARFKHKEDF